MVGWTVAASVPAALATFASVGIILTLTRGRLGGLYCPTGGSWYQFRHIGTKVIAYNPRRRCARKRVGVSDLVPVSSWGDEDTIEQGPGVWIVRGEDEEERP